jgi:subfamily B ATP-binding cassette protein MsbA
MTLFQTLKRFYTPLLHHKTLLIKLIIGRSIFSGYSFLNVRLLGDITTYLETGTADKFYVIAIIASISLGVYHLLSYISRHWRWSKVWYAHYNVLNNLYIKQIIRFDNNKFESLGVGKTIGIIDEGIEWRTNAALEMTGTSVSLIFTILFWFWYAADIHRYGIILYTVILVTMGFMVAILQKKIAKPLDWRDKSEDDYTHQIVKILMSKFEILLNNKSDKEIEVLERHNDAAGEHNIKVNHIYFLAGNLPKLLINIARVWVFFYVWMGYFTGDYTLTQFTTTLSLLVLFDTVIANVMDTYLENSRHFSRIKQFWKLLDQTPTISNYDTGKSFKYKDGSITIDNITFWYHKKNIFKNLNLHITWGRKTALIGVSGSGKTTLIKLIAGYFNPLQGKVLIDGQDLAKTKLTSYYKHIGYLTQEPSVFDGTIGENLTYGVPHKPSKKEIKKAIALAHCDFIYDFPEELETQIGEKGIRLSGGQKQRLAIAKIFLRNPKIILLDEPTAALDSISEKLVTNALNKLFVNRTVIVIAHRLQTVRNADEIIVFENGKIVEKWSHKQLHKAGGIYQHMTALQSDVLYHD